MGVELTNIKEKWFKKIRDSKKRFDKDRLLLDYCKDKEVLDVGCVGQDIDYTNPKWIHNQVKGLAKDLVGVDINHHGIEELKKMNFNIFHYDDMKLSKKFDVILMLDVIEHVDNPIEFLQNYKSFLKDDGVMIVTTPNSNRAINFINIFFKNEYSLNYEHTFWLCPKTFMELLNRVDTLEAKEFFWLNHYTLPKNINWKNRIIYFLDKILVNLKSNFSPNFMFILKVSR